MDVGATLGGLNIVDVIIGVALFGLFILGFAQGAVRRGVGVATLTFSFFLAGQLNQFLGKFLAENWVQYPPAYSYMIGYLVLFLAGVIAFFLVVQVTYRKVEMFTRFPVMDEVLGGLLGVTWGLLLLMYLTIILDTYFLLAPVGDPDEIRILRDIWVAIDASWFGQLLQQQVIPVFVAWTGFLLPATVTDLFQGS